MGMSWEVLMANFRKTGIFLGPKDRLFYLKIDVFCFAFADMLYTWFAGF